MYFKSDLHESIFFDVIKRLNLGNENKQYKVFAYMAAATEKTQITEVFAQHDIDFDVLLEMSRNWSASEKYLIELGSQFSDGSIFYHIEKDASSWMEQEKKAENLSIENRVEGLDESNIKVVLSAIQFINT